MLKYLNERHSDCLISSTPLYEPTPPLEEYLPRIQNIQRLLIEQNTEDTKTIAAKKLTRPFGSYWAIKPPEPSAVNYTPDHRCRLLLGHLGFVTLEKKKSFTLLENSSRFYRSLAQLDKTPGREMMKIGLICVKEGQEDQKIILRNDTAHRSPIYEELVNGLGWEVDVPSHKGYLGGLDKKMTTGPVALYYANSTMEVIFHEITLMPTVENDEQQILKKRHVGNDIVHIVWSEHCRNYKPDTITSQFNDAHIVIYPLPNGLFRVQIFRKEEKIPLFGPLIHGMAINKQLLAQLVRATAINANRYVRYNTEGYMRPYPTRQKQLAEITSRYKTNKEFTPFNLDVIQQRREPKENDPSTDISSPPLSPHTRETTPGEKENSTKN